MKFFEFFKALKHLYDQPKHQQSEPTMRIVVHSPGGPFGKPCIDVKAIYDGIDWDNGTIFIEPVQALTVLTPEQVAEISESVRKGQSWHAYEAYKKHKAQLDNAALEYAKLVGQRDELLAALKFSREVFHLMGEQARTKADQEYFRGLLASGNPIDAALDSAKGGEA